MYVVGSVMIRYQERDGRETSRFVPLSKYLMLHKVVHVYANLLNLSQTVLRSRFGASVHYSHVKYRYVYANKDKMEFVWPI